MANARQKIRCLWQEYSERYFAKISEIVCIYKYVHMQNKSTEEHECDDSNNEMTNNKNPHIYLRKYSQIRVFFSNYSPTLIY